MKLKKKTRVGSKLKRQYDKPQTPLERVLKCPQADSVKVQQLKRLRAQTDPFELAKRLEQKLQRIFAMANQRVSPLPKDPISPSPTRSEKQTLGEIAKILELNSRNDPDGLDRSRHCESNRQQNSWGPKSPAHTPLAPGMSW